MKSIRGFVSWLTLPLIPEGGLEIVELMTVSLQTVCALTRGRQQFYTLCKYIPFFWLDMHLAKRNSLQSPQFHGYPVPSFIAVRCFRNTLELLPSGQTLKYHTREASENAS